MGCEMSRGMLLVGLGVPPKSQQVLCPFHPLPSMSVGNVVEGGDGGASDARGPVCTVPLPLRPFRARGERQQLRTETMQGLQD